MPLVTEWLGIFKYDLTKFGKGTLSKHEVRSLGLPLLIVRPWKFEKLLVLDHSTRYLLPVLFLAF